MPEWRRLCSLEVLWLGSYLVLSVLSSLLSAYPSFAIWGSYEQWEGLFVLLAYGIFFLYVYLTVDTEWIVRLVVYGLVAGGFLMGLLGTFQFFGMDLFRGKAGQMLMNLLSENKMKFTFNFSEGWVYASLYNPNYVGSYAALLLPVDRLFPDRKKLVLPSAVEKKIRNGMTAVLPELDQGEYRVYSQDGTFLAVCRAKGGKLTTVKSFFEV